MSDFFEMPVSPFEHKHVFLGRTHEKNERRTWVVIWLCTAMMLAEIIGGSLFGSLALIADGWHMSTHAGALLLAALAYTYARRHAEDPSFAFGTGKIGDLAGYTSAIVLAFIALLICYEAVLRLMHPVAIDFAEAIPIAVAGLAVNVVSAFMLSGGDEGHHHGHAHSHSHAQGAGQSHTHHSQPAHLIDTGRGLLDLEIFEIGEPPRFRIRKNAGLAFVQSDIALETQRPDGERQAFTFVQREGFWESVETIPEPHEFTAIVRLNEADWQFEHPVTFVEDAQANAQAHVPAHRGAVGKIARDNNMRAAFFHVIGDAAVSVLVITGLLLAQSFRWLWLDPAAGIIGSAVIASWSYVLLRDTSAVLLDRTADRGIARDIRQAVEAGGDRLTDLHLWRLGPGHLAAIVSVATRSGRGASFYHALLRRFQALSHVTVEISRSN
jgi:cation diffusion facilitator family transporter